jgi:hypothetical protein
MKPIPIETLNPTPNLRVEIHTDDNAEPPDMDRLGQIAYCSSRETLGTENVSRERLDEIRDGINDGSLIGLAVYAYVHGGATIRCAPFGDRWDSGQSGFVYCTKEKAEKEYPPYTANFKEKALDVLRAEVKEFDQYLTGDVYGVMVFQGDEQVDSCWGIYGIVWAREYAQELSSYWQKQESKEAAERQAWAERDVVTT